MITKLNYIRHIILLSTSLCLLSTQTTRACQIEPDKNVMDSLFELSLQEVINLKVEGAAVKDIGLNMQAVTNNPFNLTNCHTPASIEIIDKHTIQARGLNNVVEVVQSMVGVISGESPSEPYSFSMRGFTGNSIKVLVNGISMGQSTFNMRPLSTSNLQRVEILKGASSLHLGQGSAGGTINMVSKRASLTQLHHRDIRLAKGTLDTSHMAQFSGPINDSMAYHLNVNYRASDGWVDDSHAEYINSESSYYYQINDTLNITFSIDLQQDDLPSYWGTPMVPNSVAQNAVTDVIKTEDNLVIDRATLGNNYNVADHVISSKSHWQTIRLNWAPSEQLKNQTTLYQFSAKRLWKNAESYIYNSTTGNLDRDRLYVKHDRELFGLQSGFTLEQDVASLPSVFSLHLEYSENDFDHFVGFEPVDFFVDDINIHNPDAGAFNSFDVAGTVDIKKDTLLLKMTSVTLSNHSKISQNLALNTSYKMEDLYIDRAFYNFDESIRENKTIKKSYQQSSYSLGLVYALTPSVTAYTQFSKQHDDISGDFIAVSDISAFKPADLIHMEVGLKATLDEHSEFTLALYDIEKESVSQKSGEAVTINEQHSQGLEFAIRTIINERLRIGGNLAYTQAKFGDFYNDDTETDISNNTPVNVPEKTASIWGSINRIAQLPLEAGLGINYVSSRYANISNTVTLLDYTLVNAFASYSHKDFRLALHIRNLTDQVYAPWSDIYYPGQVIIAPPRTIELNFQTSFSY